MSQQSVRQNYIQAEVLTATPQKLQLLLVEAAIKNIHRTKQFWLESNYDSAFETLTRAQDIVAEILCSLDVENCPDIAKKLASIYVFIFRRLTEAGMRHDAEKLDDALKVLASERETWRLVCEKFGSNVNDSPKGETGSGDAWSSATPAPSATAPQQIAPVNEPPRKAINSGSVSLDLSSSTPSTPTPSPGMPNPLAPPNTTKPVQAKPSTQNIGFSWDA